MEREIPDGPSASPAGHYLAMLRAARDFGLEPAETGTKVVANLYDDALGDPPVTSYEAVIRWDTQQLVAALR